jgi:hypothetical protein
LSGKYSRGGPHCKLFIKQKETPTNLYKEKQKGKNASGGQQG